MLTRKNLQRGGFLGALFGLLLALWGLFVDPVQFWRSYLLAYIFWLQIGLGCLGMVMLHHLVGGRWSALIRRLMEAGAMTLPLMALLFLPLLWGLTTLYPWADSAQLQQSELLQSKAAYLNRPFFLLRALCYFVVWLGLAYLLNHWSQSQDQTGEPRLAVQLRRLSAAGMILYVLTATFAAYDWLMSLEPEWFSSIYGLLFIAGQAIAALAVAIIGLRVLAKCNFVESDWRPAFNDLGNLLLGFVMIWAYFSYSQFLIIWSANLPEEALWYLHRSQGGWLTIGFFLIAFHFALPFLLLLSRRIKRTARWLAILAGLIFFARLLDLYWLITPAFYPESVHLHWLDGVLWLAIGGGWLTLFVQQWSRKAPLPLHDPVLGEVDEESAAFPGVYENGHQA